MTINHPYPGPNFTEWAAGSFTISIAGTIPASIEGKYFELSMNDTTTFAYIIGAGDDSTTKGPHLDGVSRYWPGTNLNQLKFRSGGAESITVNYLVGK